MPAPAALWMRDLRTAANLTQEGLAEASGISDRTIRTLEAGLARQPHRETLCRIGRALRLDPAGVELFVDSWRAEAKAPRPIEKMFEDVGLGRSLPARMARQRDRIRDVSTVEHASIGADRSLARVEIWRTVEPVGDGVDGYLWMSSLDPTIAEPSAMAPTGLFNCRLRGLHVLAGQHVIAVDLAFDRTLERGEKYSFGYTMDFGAARRSEGTPASTEVEVLVGLRAPGGFLSLQLQFDASVEPIRPRHVREPTLGGAEHAVADVQLSAFHTAGITVERPGIGAHGIRWDWD